MEVLDFAAAKRKRVTDNTKWSPEDCLVDMLEDIRAGRYTPKSLFIVACTEHENGAIERLSYARAGCTRERELSLLSFAKRELLENW